jgi:beta-lactamase regulating signal transducer with metallopeptidase domain
MTFEMLLIHPVVQALGWSLLHFLWQGALLAIFLWAAQGLASRSSARVRYALGCLVMLLMPAIFLATVVQSYPSQTPASASRVTLRPSAALAAVPATNTPVPASLRGLPGWSVCIWLAGVLILSLSTAGGWIRVQRLRRRGTRIPHPVWIDTLESLKQRLGVSRPVRLYVSAIAEVPTVIGWARPLILLPATALTGLSESQLRAILAHELAHIRRYDYLVNLLQTAVETLLFYHPAVWWVGRQIRREREHCCDDLAVDACGDVILYAGALTRIEELRGRAPEPALAASGGDLLARIRRLTSRGGNEERIPKSLGGTVAAVLVLCVIGMSMLRSVNAAPQNPPAESPAPAAPRPPVETRKGLGQDAGKGNGEGVGKGLGGGVGAGVGAGIGGGEQEPSARGVDLLLKLYDSTQDIQVKLEVLSYLAGSSSAKASEKILSISRADPNPQLRREAISYVAGEAKSFETLVSLYDGTTEPEAKLAILDYIGGLADPKAADKLFSIAQSDPLPQLRMAAVAYLAGR